ncbi:MAG: dynein heavy chain [Marteilia pararefringens]
MIFFFNSEFKECNALTDLGRNCSKILSIFDVWDLEFSKFVMFFKKCYAGNQLFTIGEILNNEFIPDSENQKHSGVNFPANPIEILNRFVPMFQHIKDDIEFIRNVYLQYNNFQSFIKNKHGLDEIQQILHGNDLLMDNSMINEILKNCEHASVLFMEFKTHIIFSDSPLCNEIEVSNIYAKLKDTFYKLEACCCSLFDLCVSKSGSRITKLVQINKHFAILSNCEYFMNHISNYIKLIKDYINQCIKEEQKNLYNVKHDLQESKDSYSKYMMQFNNICKNLYYLSRYVSLSSDDKNSDYSSEIQNIMIEVRLIKSNLFNEWLRGIEKNYEIFETHLLIKISNNKYFPYILDSPACIKCLELVKDFQAFLNDGFEISSDLMTLIGQIHENEQNLINMMNFFEKMDYFIAYIVKEGNQDLGNYFLQELNSINNSMERALEYTICDFQWSLISEQATENLSEIYDKLYILNKSEVSIQKYKSELNGPKCEYFWQIVAKISDFLINIDATIANIIAEQLRDLKDSACRISLKYLTNFFETAIDKLSHGFLLRFKYCNSLVSKKFRININLNCDALPTLMMSDKQLNNIISGPQTDHINPLIASLDHLASIEPKFANYEKQKDELMKLRNNFVLLIEEAISVIHSRFDNLSNFWSSIINDDFDKICYYYDAESIVNFVELSEKYLFPTKQKYLVKESFFYFHIDIDHSNISRLHQKIEQIIPRISDRIHILIQNSANRHAMKTCDEYLNSSSPLITFQLLEILSDYIENKNCLESNLDILIKLMESLNRLCKKINIKSVFTCDQIKSYNDHIHQYNTCIQSSIEKIKTNREHCLQIIREQVDSMSIQFNTITKNVSNNLTNFLIGNITNDDGFNSLLMQTLEKTSNLSTESKYVRQILLSLDICAESDLKDFKFMNQSCCCITKLIESNFAILVELRAEFIKNIIKFKPKNGQLDFEMLSDIDRYILSCQNDHCPIKSYFMNICSKITSESKDLVKFMMLPNYSTSVWTELIEIINKTGNCKEIKYFRFIHLIFDEFATYRKHFVDLIEKNQGKFSILSLLDETFSKFNTICLDYDHSCLGGSKIKVVRNFGELITIKISIEGAIKVIYNSPFVKYYMEKFGKLQLAFNIFNENLTKYSKLQKTFVYLSRIDLSPESLTIGDDIHTICLEFQNLAKDYSLIVEYFSSNMNSILAENSQIITKISLLQDSFNNLNDIFLQFLKKQQEQFPQLYFCDDSTIISFYMLKIGVKDDLIKCTKILYPNFKELLFDPNNPSLLVKLRTIYEEFIEFVEPIDLHKLHSRSEYLSKLSKNVEQSLKIGTFALIEKFRTIHSLRDNTFLDALTDLHIPFQCIHIMLRKVFTTQISNLVTERKENEFTELSNICKLVNQRLSTLIEANQEKSSMIKRVKEAIIIISDYRRLVEKFQLTRQLDGNCPKYIELVYLWQNFIHYYHIGSDIIVKCGLYSSTYRFNYVPFPNSIIISHLTARIFEFITHGLYFNLGSVLQGVAGTGKTESIKYLAALFGLNAIIINCGSSYNHKSLLIAIKAAIGLDTWLCFDEFNRTEQTVMSSISQVITKIQHHQEIDKSTAHVSNGIEIFLDEGIRVVKKNNFALFITMNPDYIGRNKLLDNIRQHFQSFSIESSDLITLVACFLECNLFSHAKEHSKNVISFFQMCSLIFKRYSYYDFGLRAMKNIIFLASKNLIELKNQNISNRDAYELENYVIHKFCKIYFTNRLDIKDIVLLDEILLKTFNKVNLNVPDSSMRDNQTLINIFDSKINSNGELFISKCLNHYEILKSTFASIIIDPSQLNGQLFIDIIENVHHSRISKFYVELDHFKSNLLGDFDEFTGKWQEGIVTRIIKQSNSIIELNEKILDNSGNQTPNSVWIILSGHLDADWMESINSLLDDSKCLTLPNGEIIYVRPEMRLFFLTDSLSNLSLASISRCSTLVLSSNSFSSIENVFAKLRSKFSDKFSIDIFDMLSPICRELCDYVHWSKNNPKITDTYDTYMITNLFLEQFIHASHIIHNAAKEVITQDYTKQVVSLSLYYLLINHQNSSILSQSISKLVYNEPDKFEFSSALSILIDYRAKNYSDYFQSDSNLMSSNIKQSMLDDYIPFPESEALIRIISSAYSRSYAEKNLEVSVLQKCILLHGPPGTGKSFLIKQSFANSNHWDVVTFNFSANTTSTDLLNYLESVCNYMESSDGGEQILFMTPNPETYNKGLIVFIDEINLPKSNKYGTTEVLELLADLIQKSSFTHPIYLKRVELQNILFIAACNPQSQSDYDLALPDRLVRQFISLYVDGMSELTIKHFVHIHLIRIMRLFATCDTINESVVAFCADTLTNLFIKVKTITASNKIVYLTIRDLKRYFSLLESNLKRNNSQLNTKDLNYIIFSLIKIVFKSKVDPEHKDRYKKILLETRELLDLNNLEDDIYSNKYLIDRNHKDFDVADKFYFRLSFGKKWMNIVQTIVDVISIPSMHLILFSKLHSDVHSLILKSSMKSCSTFEEITITSKKSMKQFIEELSLKILNTFTTTHSSVLSAQLLENNLKISVKCIHRIAITLADEMQSNFPINKWKLFVDYSMRKLEEMIYSQIEDGLHLSKCLQKFNETLRELKELKSVLERQKRDMSEKSLKASENLDILIEKKRICEEEYAHAISIEKELMLQSDVESERKQQIEDEFAMVIPALEESKKLIKGISKENLSELKSLQSPPKLIKYILEIASLILSKEVSSWKELRSFIISDSFMPRILDFDIQQYAPTFSQKIIRKLTDIDYIDINVAFRANYACGNLAQWINAILKYLKVNKKCEPFTKEIKALHESIESKKENLKNISQKLGVLESEIKDMKTNYEALIYDSEATKVSLQRNEVKFKNCQFLIDSMSTELLSWQNRLDELQNCLEISFAKEIFNSCCDTIIPGLNSENIVKFKKSISEIIESYFGIESDINFDDLLEKDVSKKSAVKMDIMNLKLPIFSDFIYKSKAFVSRSKLYTLCLDSQNFLKPYLDDNKSNFVFTRFVDEDFEQKLVNSVQSGRILVINSLDGYDSILDNVAQQNYHEINGVNGVMINGVFIPVSPQFNLILYCQNIELSNIPQYIQSIFMIINFDFTLLSMIEQLSDIFFKFLSKTLYENYMDALSGILENKNKIFNLENRMMNIIGQSDCELIDNSQIIESVKELKENKRQLEETFQIQSKCFEEIKLNNFQLKKCSKFFSALFYKLYEVSKVCLPFPINLNEYHICIINSIDDANFEDDDISLNKFANYMLTKILGYFKVSFAFSQFNEVTDFVKNDEYMLENIGIFNSELNKPIKSINDQLQILLPTTITKLPTIILSNSPKNIFQLLKQKTSHIPDLVFENITMERDFDELNRNFALCRDNAIKSKFFKIILVDNCYLELEKLNSIINLALDHQSIAENYHLIFNVDFNHFLPKNIHDKCHKCIVESSPTIDSQISSIIAYTLDQINEENLDSTMVKIIVRTILCYAALMSSSNLAPLLLSTCYDFSYLEAWQIIEIAITLFNSYDATNNNLQDLRKMVQDLQIRIFRNYFKSKISSTNDLYIAQLYWKFFLNPNSITQNYIQINEVVIELPDSVKRMIDEKFLMQLKAIFEINIVDEQQYSRPKAIESNSASPINASRQEIAMISDFLSSKLNNCDDQLIFETFVKNFKSKIDEKAEDNYDQSNNLRISSSSSWFLSISQIKELTELDLSYLKHSKFKDLFAKIIYALSIFYKLDISRINVCMQLGGSNSIENYSHKLIHKLSLTSIMTCGFNYETISSDKISFFATKCPNNQEIYPCQPIILNFFYQENNCDPVNRKTDFYLNIYDSILKENAIESIPMEVNHPNIDRIPIYSPYIFIE